MSQQPESAEQKLREAYDKSEKKMSGAADQLVAGQGFGETLAFVTSNLMAMSRIVTTGLDQAVRSSRLAGQRDITRLGRQLNRTEDKLERVLQVVESLEDELARTRAERDAAQAKSQGSSGDAPRGGDSR